MYNYSQIRRIFDPLQFIMRARIVFHAVQYTSHKPRLYDALYTQAGFHTGFVAGS